MKMNKAVAGYHMLMMLSEADGKFESSEGAVIVEYLKEQFPFPGTLDREIDVLSTLKREEYADHFYNAALQFFSDSNEKERAEFLSYAIKLARADNEISSEENEYIDILCNAWDIN